MFKKVNPEDLKALSEPMAVKPVEKKVEKREIIQVVSKLPVQEIRRAELKDSNGNDVIVHYMTLEEWATAQANAS